MRTSFAGPIRSLHEIRPQNRLPTLLFVFSLTALTAFGQNDVQREKRLYVFDVEAYFDAHPRRSRAWQYDVLNLLASLQGLVNRPEPDGRVPDDLLYLVYIRDTRISGSYVNIDRYWLEKLRYPGELLADYRTIEATDLLSLLRNEDIKEHYERTVLWDENVPATANVAATICAVEGFLPVRYDTKEGSLLSEIDVPVGLNLDHRFQGYGDIWDTSERSTRSRKGDAYTWAKTRYLARCRPSDPSDPPELAYYLDGFDWDQNEPGFQCPDLMNACVLNHDFFISRRAFFFDLDPWWDEQATDERAMVAATSREELRTLPEGVDASILKEILGFAEYQTRSLRKMIRIAGFVPWHLKYTDHGTAGGKHNVTETQREFIAIASSFNAFVESDVYPFAGLANASVFQHVKLEEPFEQNAIPEPAELEEKIYLLFYMGDYESAACLAQAVPVIWDNASRGRLPLAWGINPTLADRVPQAFNYLFRTRTLNDYFVGTRSGAGWVDPEFLMEVNRRHSDLGNGLDIWIKHSHSWYRKFDIQITGLVDTALPPVSRPVQESFFSFSPHGVGTSGRFFEPLSRRLVPFCRHTATLPYLTTSVEQFVKTIADRRPKEKPAFQIYHCYLITPTNLFLAVQGLQQQYPGEYEVLDPYTFFYLLREHHGGTNEGIAFFREVAFDPECAEPQQITAGQVVWCKARMRNDGWDMWNPKETPANKRYRLAYSWIDPSRDGKETPGGATTYIPGQVEIGETIDVDLQVQAPLSAGLYTLRLYLDREGRKPEEQPLNWEEINVVVSEPTR